MNYFKQKQTINEIGNELKPKTVKEKCTGKQIHLINKLLMNDIQEVFVNLQEHQKLEISFSPVGKPEMTLNVSYDTKALTIFPSCTKSIASSLIDAINEKKYKLVIR